MKTIRNGLISLTIGITLLLLAKNAGVENMDFMVIIITALVTGLTYTL